MPAWQKHIQRHTDIQTIYEICLKLPNMTSEPRQWDRSAVFIKTLAKN